VNIKREKTSRRNKEKEIFFFIKEQTDGFNFDGERKEEDFHLC
jgi:hypothetical protein